MDRELLSVAIVTPAPLVNLNTLSIFLQSLSICSFVSRYVLTTKYLEHRVMSSTVTVFLSGTCFINMVSILSIYNNRSCSASSLAAVVHCKSFVDSCDSIVDLSLIHI